LPLNRCQIDAPPGRVFKILADPRAYAYWVVGSKRIRGADPDWPAVGSAFHHAVGFGPLKVRDHTRVLAVRKGRMIELKANARPLGTARVKLELRRRGRRTVVTMTEAPGDRLSAILFNPVVSAVIRGRNVWSLDRLKNLAEGRVVVPDDGRPSRWQFRLPAAGQGRRRRARRRRTGR
jgi:uncharacterized protein YndB with AHSA1/START domain